MKRDREVRGRREGGRKSGRLVKRSVCGWEGGGCLVTLEAARLVACSPLDMRLLTGALNQHEAPTHRKYRLERLRWGFLVDFLLFCLPQGDSVSLLFSLNSLGTVLHMLVLYIVFM